MTNKYLETITLVINGAKHTVEVEHRELLIDTLRHSLAMTGTKQSCGGQVCGVCTVLVDDVPVSSCCTLTMDCVGREIRTIESYPEDEIIQALQDSFIESGALQCGFCTPGIIMASTALLANKQGFIDEDDVRHHLHGNICRCTGYKSIISAVLQAAEKIRETSPRV